MTSREKLLQLRHDFYTNNSLVYDSISYFTSIEKDLEDLEKYKKALEIIAEYINPSIVIILGSYYWKAHVNSTEIYRALTPEAGKLLMELFGGTNYDTK